MISETWMDISASNSCVLENYRLELSNQLEFRGKGTGIYIHNSLPYCRRNDLEVSVCEFQSVFIELRNEQGKHLLFGSIYRSPSFHPLPFIEYLDQTLDNISNERKLTILGGDMNLDILKHEVSDIISTFLNTLASAGFLPCISLPTRITATSETLIDHFFCNDISLLSDPTVIVHDLSDHLPIIVNVKIQLPNHAKSQQHHTTFDFRKIDSLRTKIAQRLSNFLAIQDAEQSCINLSEILSEEIRNHSVQKPSRRNVPIQPWISYDLLRRINEKNELHNKYILSRTGENLANFKSYRNNLTTSIREAKKAYFGRKLEENSSNPKKMWKILLEDIIKRPSNKQPLPDHFIAENEPHSDPNEIASKFNDHFANVATKLESKLPVSEVDPLSFLDNINPPDSFHFSAVNAEIICLIITNLNDTGAVGDGVSTKILKKIAPTLAPYLAHLFNLCLAQSIFPTRFKQATVIPIFKSGDPFSFSNYRPISLLPVLSKILERIVYTQILDFFQAHDLLFQNQFGFRQKHSTYMPVAMLYDHVTAALADHQVCAAVYLDLSKAFDTVNPQILFKKLEKYGIKNIGPKNNPLNFFKSYLTNRTQITRYNSVTSKNTRDMPLGVPQGSILGPLLFIIYANDMHRCSPTPYYLFYADDAVLVYTAENAHLLELNIRNSLPDIITWLTCNRLTINAKKSNYQIFSNSRLPDIPICINNSPLLRNFSVRYLGVNIEENLKWCSHVRSVENTVSRNIGIIRRSKDLLSSKHILLLYNAIILPHLNYCVQVWGSSYPTRYTKLITLKKKIVRVIDHAGFLDHTGPIFKKHGILKFTDLIKVVQFNVLHQFLRNELPRVIAEKFALHPFNYARSRNVRSVQHFSVPFTTKNYRKFSLFIAAPEVWNQYIAANIRILGDVPLSKPFFKKVVKKLFIDYY